MLFRRSAVLRAVSPYLIFLKENGKKFPKVKTFPGKTHTARFVARAKALAKAYKALSKPALAQLAATAKKAPMKKRSKAKTAAAARRRTSAAVMKQVKGKKVTTNNVSAFVRRQYDAVKHKPKAARVAALVKLWRKKH